ncbi:MAG: hypothetical protein ACK4FJ_03585 [Ferrovibrio sp.]|uniref:hypothetical protein n=1 Tax=Ferrovibrio sp. TaxID=1917215 RepID=UPI00391BDC61
MRILMACAFGLSLAACTTAEQSDVYVAGFTAANAGPRHTVIVDGKVVRVYGYDGNKYDAYSVDGLDVSSIKLKRRYIRAIEQHSGCKVVEAEFQIQMPILQTEVKC